MRDLEKVLTAPVKIEDAEGNITSKPRKRISTREKIEKLVSEGAKNYPAYLKLVHTGDSDFSDDETIISRQTQHKGCNRQETSPRKSCGSDITSVALDNQTVASLQVDVQEENGNKLKRGKLTLDLKPVRGKIRTAPRKEMYYTRTLDDTFYDTVNTTGIGSAEYDNAVNQSTEPIDPEERARMEQEWKDELSKLEDEITTLRQVLGAKVRASNELKRKLGITPIGEFRHDLKQGFQNIKESDAYKTTSERLTQLNEKITSSPAYVKTNEKIHQVGDKISQTEAYQKTNATLKTVGQKTAAAVTGVGAFASRKLSDVRNSTAFKSFEEKVGGAYTNVKTRVRGSKSENNFEDVLNSTADAERDGSQDSSPATSPDGKVPL